MYAWISKWKIIQTTSETIHDRKASFFPFYFSTPSRVYPYESMIQKKQHVKWRLDERSHPLNIGDTRCVVFIVPFHINQTTGVDRYNRTGAYN